MRHAHDNDDAREGATTAFQARQAMPPGGPGRAVLTAAFLVVVAPAAFASERTERVSVGLGGQQGDGQSRNPSISAQGRYVAFDSRAVNLVPGATNASGDVILHDRRTGTLTLVSVGRDGQEADGDSYEPLISRGGRFVAFISNARNLVPGVEVPDGGSIPVQVYLRDLVEGTTVLASANAGGEPADGRASLAAISGDGRFVVFSSSANNLVQGVAGSPDYPNLYVRDMRTGAVTLGDAGTNGRPGDAAAGGDAAITPDGRWLAFGSRAGNLVPGDRNGEYDVFLRDRQTGRTVLVSVALGGGPAGGGLPNDDFGRDVAISDDGGQIAFTSLAPDLVPGDTNGRGDAFVRDVGAGRTERVSVATGGAQTAGGGYRASMSADGRRVAFLSSAPDLVPGDTNRRTDVFVGDRAAGTTVRASVAADGA